MPYMFTFIIFQKLRLTTDFHNMYVLTIINRLTFLDSSTTEYFASEVKYPTHTRGRNTVGLVKIVLSIVQWVCYIFVAIQKEAVLQWAICPYLNDIKLQTEGLQLGKAQRYACHVETTVWTTPLYRPVQSIQYMRCSLLMLQCTFTS